MTGRQGPTWRSESRAADYLRRADTLGRRAEGERTLLELLPGHVEHFVDLGTGHGRLATLVLDSHPDATATLVDVSPQMLSAASAKFASDGRVRLIEADLADGLPNVPASDLIVSAFAIHHLPHRRKAELYAECAANLAAGGLLANLELVTSSSEAKHREFRRVLRPDDGWDDPEDKLAGVESQLEWLRAAGLEDVDCYWRWRGMALLCGWRN